MRSPIEDFKRLHQFYKWSPYFQIKDLAQWCRVTPRTIHRWLSGKTKPNQARLRQIATYLDNKLGLLQGVREVYPSFDISFLERTDSHLRDRFLKTS